jgi:hypothetical protein
MICLLDIDSVIPNIALMKLSAFFKSKGKSVVLKKLSIDYYGRKNNFTRVVDSEKYEHVFGSCIFENSIGQVNFSSLKNVTVGGSGYDLHFDLPDEIEKLYPDYSLYGESEGYGFLSRGCIRKCWFCIVREKEGFLKQVAEVEEIVRDKKVFHFMDNNFLALENHCSLLREIIKMGIRCEFLHGLDIRLVTEENSELLSKLNYLSEYTFAFDNLEDYELIEQKLDLLKWRKPWQVKFLLYVHPDMSYSNINFRINWCIQNKCLPYIMRDMSCYSAKNSELYTDLAAYCNQPAFVKNMSFQAFLRERHSNDERYWKTVDELLVA